MAPKDPGRYILQYQLYEDQDVSLEERIDVLEELKKHDYREKWAYELAYLYHRVGLATRCVEECDELILWFGDGEYVIKAMELKMLHQPLTPEQQEKYDHRFDQKPEEENESEEETAGEEQASDAEDAEQADTAADAADKEAGYLPVTGDTIVYEPVRLPADTEATDDVEEAFAESSEAADDVAEDGELYDETGAEDGTEVQEAASVAQMPVAEPARDTEELDFFVKTMDVGQYNTINLQAELAQELKQLLGDDLSDIQQSEAETVSAAPTQTIVLPEAVRRTVEPTHVDTESLDALGIDEIEEEDLEPEVGEMEHSEIFFEQTGEIVMDQMRTEQRRAELKQEEEAEAEPVEDGQESAGQPQAEPIYDRMSTQATVEPAASGMRQVYPAGANMHVEPPKEMAGVLSQEPDGQLRIVMPEKSPIEKQITGQMNIQDVLAEWERMKQQNLEKREEEVRQHVLQQTGNMFTEFEASVRDGLLEKLENSEEPLKTDEMVELENAFRTETHAPQEEAPEDAVNFAELSDREQVPAEAEISEDDAVEELAEIEVGATADEIAEADEAEDTAAEDMTADEAEETEELAEIEGTEAVDDVAEADETAEVEEAEETDEAADNAAEADELAEVEEAEETDEAAEDTAETDMNADEAEETEELAEVEETEAADETDEAADTAEDDETEDVEESGQQTKTRAMTREERELFADYIQSKATKEQIVWAIDNISMAAYTGNVIITGEVDVDTIPLAKKLIREVQASDSNFSGQVAKISGKGLGRKNMDTTLQQLQNGALIVQNASGMSEQTVSDLYKALQKESLGIIVILQDDTKSMNRFLKQHEKLQDVFTARIDVKALSNDMLVAYGRRYAKEQEYSIDELGVLALHNRIEQRQSIDHAVTNAEVKAIVDAAIRHANKKTLGHFFDILVAKRYDEEDMIIVTEKDFV